MTRVCSDFPSEHLCQHVTDVILRSGEQSNYDNLAIFLRCIQRPEEMALWSLTSLQLKLIKIGARVVRPRPCHCRGLKCDRPK